LQNAVKKRTRAQEGCLNVRTSGWEKDQNIEVGLFHADFLTEFQARFHLPKFILFKLLFSQHLAIHSLLGKIDPSINRGVGILDK